MKDLSTIPQVDQLLANDILASWFARLSRPVVKRLVREYLDEIRTQVRQTGSIPSEPMIVDAIDTKCREFYRAYLQPVINATGIVLHTNLGRSPIPAKIWQTAEKLNCNYLNLEMDIASGKRAGRGGMVSRLLCLLTGAQDALVVNNNAAAVYFVLSVLAAGKEVIVSRGQQVQIGGGFRIPDILIRSGALMKEVGTTNITTMEDYLRAITPQTAMVLMVHPSNYRIKGFTSHPTISQLRHALPPQVLLIMDQGCGVTDENLSSETPVRKILQHGADLVTFSTDKIFGGPQGGIIAGRHDLIKTLKNDAMMRVFRVGKTIYSLLEALLVDKLNGQSSSAAQQALECGADDLKKRALKLLRRLKIPQASLVPSTWSLGGGSTPELEHPSWSVRLQPSGSADDLIEKLNLGSPAILGVIRNAAVELNVATLHQDELSHVVSAVQAIYNGD